jgi:hypothetical protein
MVDLETHIHQNGIYLLYGFPSWENQYYSEHDKNITF